MGREEDAAKMGTFLWLVAAPKALTCDRRHLLASERVLKK